MPEAALNIAKEKLDAAPKESKAKTEKPAKESASRSNFSKLYPEDAKVKLLVESNPKRAGSKSAERFEAWFGSETVGDYLAKGGTYQDVAFDVGRGFVQIG